MEKIIEVNNVSMHFRMANDHTKSLKEYLVNLLKGKLKYKPFIALDKVDFYVEKGETVGLIGHNGAGKSTMLKVISGILKPTAGTMTIRGNVVPMLELGSGFDMDMTGRENIFLNGAILGYTEKFLKSKYDDIVAFSGLETFMNTPLRNYSSGMITRLAFSIAAMVNPEVLIVDEILGVGDQAFQKKSYERMQEMMSGGTTVLMVSHDIEQVAKMCRRVVWLDHGKVVEVGPAAEVCERYAASMESKTEGKKDE